MATQERHLFMCPPQYFQLDYAINEWTDTTRRVHQDRALEQWEQLLFTYRSLGAEVQVLEPEPGVSEMTFAGDSIFLFGDQALSGRFRHGERMAEVAPMAQRFARAGYRVHRLPKGMYFEGNAEALYWNDMLLGGWGVRSDRAALFHLGELLDLEVHTFQLTQPYYHFDVCFAPIDAGLALYYPGAFRDEGVALLKRLCPRLIAVDETEARALACNSVSVGDTVVMSTRGAKRTAQQLRAAGKRVIALELSEFRKAGGGAKCLTLEAYIPAFRRSAVA